MLKTLFSIKKTLKAFDLSGAPPKIYLLMQTHFSWELINYIFTVFIHSVYCNESQILHQSFI